MAVTTAQSCLAGDPCIVLRVTQVLCACVSARVCVRAYVYELASNDNAHMCVFIAYTCICVALHIIVLVHTKHSVYVHIYIYVRAVYVRAYVCI